jgi:hypothetical protein
MEDRLRVLSNLMDVALGFAGGATGLFYFGWGAGSSLLLGAAFALAGYGLRVMVSRIRKARNA